MQTLRSENRKANKDHKCDWCGFIISKGTNYTNSACLDGSDVWTWKNHIECSELCQAMGLFDDVYEGVSFDYFHDAVTEAYKDIMIGFGHKVDYKYKYPEFGIMLEEVKRKFIYEKLTK